MRRQGFAFVLLSMVAASAIAQQTIYWKKDHVYDGPGGKEIAVVLPVPTDQTAPTAPAGLSGSALSSTAIQLTWSGSSDSGGSGLAGYKIYRQRGTGAALPVGTVGANAFSFVDQPLTPSTSYTYSLSSAHDKRI